MAQRISDEDIEFITDSLIPVLRHVAEQAQGGESADTAKMEATLDAIEPLLSVEMLKVLQLMGFNFKRAIGEPLTLLVQKFIMSKMALDQQTSLESARLNLAFNTEVLKVSQDAEATMRYKQLLGVWTSNGHEN